MNAIALLKDDHERAMDLIEQLENMDENEGGSGAQKLFKQLKSELTLHTKIEEKVFYPAMEEFEETSERITEAFSDHEEIDRVLAELSDLSPDEEEFQDRLAELKEKIESHVDEEENELFPAAERLCSESQLREMGREMEQMKKGKAATAQTKKGKTATASRRK